MEPGRPPAAATVHDGHVPQEPELAMRAIPKRPMTWAVVASTLLAGCTDGSTPTAIAYVRQSPPIARTLVIARAAEVAVPADARVVLTSPSTQSGIAGGVVTLSARVLTAAGAPIANVSVTWEVTGGGGTLLDVLPATDAYGVSRATLELGPAPGVNTVRARVATAGGPRELVSQVVGRAPAAVTTFAMFGGDGQRMGPGRRLDDLLVVRAVGPTGRGVPNVPVRWATASGGSFRLVTVMTNVNGYAYGDWLLGPDAGTQTATATLAGQPPVTFTATSDPAAVPVVASITFGVGNTWLEPGETSSLTASALSVRSRGVAGTVFVWSVDRPDLLAITPEEGPLLGSSRLQYRALAPGEATITVSAGGLTRTLRIRVFPTGGRPGPGTGCGGCG